MLFNGLATSPLNKRPRLPGARSIAALRVSRLTDGMAAPCTPVFYDLLGGAQDLDLHGRAPQRSLEFPDLGVGLAQLAGRHHVLPGLHRRRRARLGEPLPVADHTRRDVELATELGHCLLPRHDPLNGRPLELRREHPSAVCLPPMLPHGTSRRILRAHGEQSKRGALQSSPATKFRFLTSLTRYCTKRA